MSNPCCTCPICGASEIADFEKRGFTPVMMHQLYASKEEAVACTRGMLDLIRCSDCGFVWNASFDASLVAYDGDYENDQSNSPVFSRHIRERVADMLAEVPPGTPIDYLEIGCGQGDVIRLLGEVAGDRLRSAEGFDPAWRGQTGQFDGSIRFHKCFFDESTVRSLTHSPNIVASRHTIEHVPDPVKFLSDIRKALGQTSATIFIETPCADWIVAHRAFQDLFYEHCSILTPAAIGTAFVRAGFHNPQIRHVFGGQYLWAKATTIPAEGDRHAEGIIKLRTSADVVSSFSLELVEHWRAQVSAAADQGRIAVWGGGAKGITFALLVDPNGSKIDHVIDINEAKQGKHIAGTGLQVLGPRESQLRGPRTIFIMNPNYADEIQKMAAGIGFSSDFVLVD